MADDKDASNPSVSWDGETISVVLPVKNGNSIRAEWKPAITYVVRMREAGTTDWSFGFETPLTQCSVVDLKPNTNYEFSVTAKNPVGKSEPVITTARTDPEGKIGSRPD